jgi:micrococcal nuclease
MNLRRIVPAVALAATCAAGLLPTATHASGVAATATTSTRARVIRWIDGDTVDTTRGRVRLIGMDTPELGQPCSRLARRVAIRRAPVGSRVRLVKVLGRDDKDRYDRKLRYVQRHGIDIGYRLIVKGLADARYDGGSYGTHPRRAKYRHADAVYPDRTCRSTTPPPPPPPSSNCDSSYPDFCIPPPPPDLDCADIGRAFRVLSPDPHNFDSDGDGWGCESYG